MYLRKGLFSRQSIGVELFWTCQLMLYYFCDIDYTCAWIGMWSRVGPDSPFALLSPVLGSEIPFEKGFLENPFSPAGNTTFCPVLGVQSPFAEPSFSFLRVFQKILVPNLIDNYCLVKFSALRANFSSTKLCCSVLQAFLSVIWSDEPQTSLEMVLFPDHPSFLVFLYIKKDLHISFLWPCFVPEISLLQKIFWPFCPVLETPNVRPHPHPKW